MWTQLWHLNINKGASHAKTFSLFFLTGSGWWHGVSVWKTGHCRSNHPITERHCFHWASLAEVILPITLLSWAFYLSPVDPLPDLRGGCSVEIPRFLRDLWNAEHSTTEFPQPLRLIDACLVVCGCWQHFFCDKVSDAWIAWLLWESANQCWGYGLISAQSWGTSSPEINMRPHSVAWTTRTTCRQRSEENLQRTRKGKGLVFSRFFYPGQPLGKRWRLLRHHHAPLYNICQYFHSQTLQAVWHGFCSTGWTPRDVYRIEQQSADKGWKICQEQKDRL